MSNGGILRGHDLFRSLTAEELEHVTSFSSPKRFSAGDVIFRQDQPASHVFLLQEGAVYLLLAGAQPELSIVVSQVAHGELFGISPLLGSTRYGASAKCTAPTALLAIEAERLRRLLQNNPVTGFHVMGWVARTYYSRYVGVMSNLQSVLNQLPIAR